MKQADAKHRQEQHGVRVRQPLDAESGGGDQLVERSARIPANFATENRVIASKHRHGGDVDDRVASGPRDAEHLRHGRAFGSFVERVKHVEGSDKIEDGARKRYCRHRGADDASAAPFTSHLQSDGGEVETICSTIRRQQVQVCTGPAAAVEDARGSFVSESAMNKRTNEPTEAAKPEMTFFGA